MAKGAKLASALHQPLVRLDKHEFRVQKGEQKTLMRLCGAKAAMAEQKRQLYPGEQKEPARDRDLLSLLGPALLEGEDAAVCQELRRLQYDVGRAGGSDRGDLSLQLFR